MTVRSLFVGKFHSWLIGMVAMGILILILFLITNQATLPSVPIPTLSGDISFHTSALPLVANAMIERDGKVIHIIDENGTVIPKDWLKENHYILVSVTDSFKLPGSIHPYDLLIGKDYFVNCEGNAKRANDFWFYAYKSDHSEATTGFDKSRFGISPCAAWKGMFPAYPSRIEDMVQIQKGDLLFIALAPEEHDRFTQRNEQARIEYRIPVISPPPVAGDIVIDDGDPGFSSTGPWTRVTQGTALYGNDRLAVALLGSKICTSSLPYCTMGERATATWEFKNLPPDQYDVFAYFRPAETLRPTTAYRIFDGETQLRIASSPVRNGAAVKKDGAWGRLGSFSIQSGILKLVTSNGENPDLHYPYPLEAIADAVMIRKSECGNNVLNASESCDDGNRLDGDGCNAECESTLVWSRALTPQGQWTNAEQNCGALVESGQTDWQLPSADELVWIFPEVQRAGLTGTVWTSTRENYPPPGRNFMRVFDLGRGLATSEDADLFAAQGLCARPRNL